MPDRADSEQSKSHDHLPGRVVGIVFSVGPREKGFMFLRGPDGQEYFSHASGWQDIHAFKAAAVTQPVSFKVTQTPSGKRAWDVRAPTEEELKTLESVDDLVEQIGDREAAAKANAVRADELAEQVPQGRRRGRNGQK